MTGPRRRGAWAQRRRMSHHQVLFCHRAPLLRSVWIRPSQPLQDVPQTRLELAMTFKPRIWYPIAAVLSVLNVAAVWFAAVPGEPMHATVHAAAALAFGLWAQRLRQRTLGSEDPAKLEELELEMNDLRLELAEAQERLDFAERVLAQGPEARRTDQQR